MGRWGGRQAERGEAWGRNEKGEATRPLPCTDDAPGLLRVALQWVGGISPKPASPSGPPSSSPAATLRMIPNSSSAHAATAR